MKVYPVILAGGKGERFWPYSNAKHPKQLLPLVTKKSMFEDTLAHCLAFAPDSPVHVIASRNLVTPMRKKVGKNNKVRIIGEPTGRNTAPALALAAALIREHDPKGVMLVLTADHAIGPQRDFLRGLHSACSVAARGESLVTLGILPVRPETGYGYIRTLRKTEDVEGCKVREVSAFIEKPDHRRAEKYLAADNYFWNSGMFAWRVDRFWQDLKIACPEITRPFDRVKKFGSGKVLDAILAKLYPKLPSESIDYALMEKASKIHCVESCFHWDDIGSWSALERLHKADQDGNIHLGKAVDLGSTNTLVFSGDGMVATMGLENILVAQVEGVTLVLPKDRVSDLKELVARVKEAKGTKKYL